MNEGNCQKGERKVAALKIAAGEESYRISRTLGTTESFEVGSLPAILGK